MLKITIDLIPGGFTPAQRTIATMRIADAGDLADFSDCRIEVTQGRNAIGGAPRRAAVREVGGNVRRQSVWALVAKAAQAALRAEHDEL
jgi:hypothetical protein